MSVLWDDSPNTMYHDGQDYEADLRTAKFVEDVVVTCHDRIGGQHKGRLECRVDGDSIDILKVPKNQEALSYPVRRNAQKIELTVHGDQVQIVQVTLYGEEQPH